jgi:hypothetical protein
MARAPPSPLVSTGSAKDAPLYGRPDTRGTLERLGDCWREWRAGAPPALRATLTNRFAAANVVYVVYAFLVVYIDTVLQPARDAASGKAAKADADAALDTAYKASAVIHLVNAFMYIWAWLPSGYSLLSPVLLPDYLNVAGAGCYLWSAWQYAAMGGVKDPLTAQVHWAETAAASIELVAAFGWCAQWYATYPRGAPNRGWTLDDPDVLANIFIVVPSIYYVAYNAIILADFKQYNTSTLYVDGNAQYALGSLFYLASSLRDDGWFSCLPAGGACAHGLCDAPPFPPPVPKAFKDMDACERVGCPAAGDWPCARGTKGAAAERSALLAPVKYSNI